MEGYFDGFISGSVVNDSCFKIFCMIYYIIICDVYLDLWYSSDYVKYMCMLIE